MTEIIATCISIGIDLIAIFLMLIWLEIKKRLGRIYKDMTDEEYILNRAKWLDNHDKEIEIKAITKCMDLVRDVLVDLDCVNATKYGNKNAKQQENSYSTIMRYEIADELDSLLDRMEQLKEQI